jgi:hypothetical protein
VRLALAITLALSVFLGGCAMVQGGGAKYESGKVQPVASDVIGSHGGTIAVTATGTPVDGVEVRFPAGALPDGTPVEVSWDRGTLSNVAGTQSGIIVRLETGKVEEFTQHVEIRVKFDPTVKPTTVTAYSIDDKSRLHVLDVASVDFARGEALIWTWQPVRFTWVLVH